MASRTGVECLPNGMKMPAWEYTRPGIRLRHRSSHTVTLVTRPGGVRGKTADSMSDFEYASVVVSIVLALGIADILRFIADIFRESGDRKLYWVHLLWIFVLLELHVEFWWRMWGFRDIVAVGPSLTFVLLGPAVLFVATRTMLPATGPDADLRALYFRRRAPFFVLMVLLNGWALAASRLHLGAGAREAAIISLASFAFVTVLFVACIFSTNRLLHTAVISVVVTLEVAEVVSLI